MEVLPNIHQLKIPNPDNSLGFVNVYLVKTVEGCLLIDTGWNTDQAFKSLEQQLAEVDVSFEDLKYIAITHVHPDHYGLVGRVENYTQATLIIHEIEHSLLHSLNIDYNDLLEEMDRWLEINGAPLLTCPACKWLRFPFGLVPVAMPVQMVHGGEHIKFGDFDLEIIWTPGHSPGHICFYDRAHKVLFSGDHILQNTTPNVSINNQTISNPLGDYLNSIRQIAQLPVEVVLPAHGEAFNHFQERLKEIEAHHKNRLKEMFTMFDGKPKTAYEIATATAWFLPWEQLPPFSKRMAVTETLSHLELLHARGLLTKSMENGIFWYTVAAKSTW